MSSINKLGIPQFLPDKGHVDNLPANSQLDPTETLFVGLPT